MTVSTSSRTSPAAEPNSEHLSLHVHAIHLGATSAVLTAHVRGDGGHRVLVVDAVAMWPCTRPAATTPNAIDAYIGSAVATYPGRVIVDLFHGYTLAKGLHRQGIAVSGLGASQCHNAARAKILGRLVLDRPLEISVEDLGVMGGRRDAAGSVLGVCGEAAYALGVAAEALAW